uniref:Uncharacterized protein n=1 Tax=Meloidogyne incognita TaxID=6306 RepID=A0A914M6D2_MELIC
MFYLVSFFIRPRLSITNIILGISEGRDQSVIQSAYYIPSYSIILGSTLAQHKAVLFFCVFTSVFSFLSIFVGACSYCFLPNAILHTISVGLAIVQFLQTFLFGWQLKMILVFGDLLLLFINNTFHMHSSFTALAH